MAYIKPQSPLKLGEDHLYPLTTYDQIIMEDGNRWDGKSGGGELDVDLTGASQGAIALTNADLLGGVAAENYMLKTDPVENSEKLGGKAPEYYLTPVNLLDNSNFANLVAQAELAGLHGTIYYLADRWLLSRGNVTVTQMNGYCSITRDASHRTYFVQKLPVNLAGKAVTLAAKVRCADKVYLEFCRHDETKINNKSFSGVDGIICYSLTLPTDATDVAVKMYLAYDDPSASVDIYWMTVYEGTYTAETLPPYVAKGYGAELAECQRYYIHGVGAGCAGYGISGQNYLITFIPTPVEMRANPVLVIDTQDNVVLYNNIIAVTGVNGAFKRSNGVLCNFALASNFPTHGAGTLGGSTSINFIADL